MTPPQANAHRDGGRFGFNPTDYYFTPATLAESALYESLGQLRLINSIQKSGWFIPSLQTALDVGAGTFVWGDALKKVYTMTNPDISVDGIDIAPRDERVKQGDFLTIPADQRYNLIFGNPPYGVEGKRSLINEICEKACQQSDFTIFLLKSDFQHGVKRCNVLFQKYPPFMVLPLVNRVSFDGTGKSNTWDYSVFVWVNKPSYYPAGMPLEPLGGKMWYSRHLYNPDGGSWKHPPETAEKIKQEVGQAAYNYWLEKNKDILSGFELKENGDAPFG